MKPIISGFFLGVLLAGSACTQSRAVYTLNPDGSGKARVLLVQPLKEWVTFKEPGEEGHLIKARKRVGEILDKSEGVEAWRDLRFQVLHTKETPYLVLEATVYFRDASLMKFEQQNRFLRPGWKKGPDGSRILEIAPRPSEKEDGKKKAKGAKPAPPVPPEEYKDLVARLQRGEERSGLRMLQMIMERYRQEIIVHLPGRLGEVQGMEKIDDRTVRLVFEGRQAARGVGQLAGDDAEKILAALEEMKVKELKDGYKVYKRIFGTTFHATATIEGKMEPQFDYKKDVAVAREEYDAMLTRLGLK